MTRAFVGLGSNLDAPQDQLDAALAALGRLERTELAGCSPRYWTAPVGDADQPEFLNAVAALDTGLAPVDLLEAMQAIEAAQGRVRDSARRWGPRPIDLDLLLYGTESIRTRDLTVPHPRLHQRAFVLRPLADLAPDLPVGDRGTVAELLAAVGSAGVRPASEEG